MNVQISRESLEPLTTRPELFATVLAFLSVVWDEIPVFEHGEETNVKNWIAGALAPVFTFLGPETFDLVDPDPNEGDRGVQFGMMKWVLADAYTHLELEGVSREEGIRRFAELSTDPEEVLGMIPLAAHTLRTKIMVLPSILRDTF
ncbi:MAG: hypothetical protein KKA90_03490 [Nanoarchaeota archaeon]|nr:hypothetical protein [Nanoarchaeota archaeon]